MRKLFLSVAILISSIFVNAKIELLDRIAIIVDEGVIMESQIVDAINTTRLRFNDQNLDLPPENVLLNEVQERLIIEELQLQLGNGAGVRISDGELNQTFIQIAANNGLNIEDFIKDYESSGQSYEKLREEVRKDMIIQRVQRGMLSNSINITEQEIAGFLSTDEAISQLTPELLIRQIQVRDIEKMNAVKEKISDGADFVSLVGQFSINPNKSENGLMPWRKINQMPSIFAEEIKGKALGYISNPIKTGSGFHFLKLEDKRGPLVKFEKQWDTRHILISPSAIKDIETAKKEAINLRERIISGEEFEKIAEEFSDDPGSAANGGSLGLMPMGVTVPQFENVMVNTNLNEISDVFESEFGFHFLQVMNIETIDVTDRQIEDQAYSILFTRKYDEELENTLRSMRAEAFVEFKDLD